MSSSCNGDFSTVISIGPNPSVQVYDSVSSRSAATQTNGRTIITEMLLFAAGLMLNYLLERHNILKIWEGSDYAVSWADLFYPPLCVLLSLTGVGLMVGGAMGRAGNRRLLLYALAYVFPLTILYTPKVGNAG